MPKASVLAVGSLLPVKESLHSALHFLAPLTTPLLMFSQLQPGPSAGFLQQWQGRNPNLLGKYLPPRNKGSQEYA